MNILIKNYLNDKSNIYVNVHKDKIIRDTEKAFCVELDDGSCVFIPKTFFLEKHQFLNYVRVYVDRNHHYCLTKDVYSDDREYIDGYDLLIHLLKSNKKWNRFSKLFREINNIDSSLFI